MSPPQPVTTILLAGPTLVMQPDGAGAEEIGGVSGPGRQAVVASARRAAVARRARVARVMAGPTVPGPQGVMPTGTAALRCGPDQPMVRGWSRNDGRAALGGSSASTRP